jgi:hypothetical protein
LTRTAIADISCVEIVNSVTMVQRRYLITISCWVKFWLEFYGTLVQRVAAFLPPLGCTATPAWTRGVSATQPKGHSLLAGLLSHRGWTRSRSRRPTGVAANVSSVYPALTSSWRPGGATISGTKFTWLRNSAGNNANDLAHECVHAGDTTAIARKTLDLHSYIFSGKWN